MFRNGDITTKMDAVTKVARDCLLACVECNILQVNIVSCGGQCCGSGSGVIAPVPDRKYQKKLRIFMFLKCWMLYYGGFPVDVASGCFYFKNIFLIKVFFQLLVIETWI